MTPVTAAEVADELYALTPAEFVAARDERARQARAAGQREQAAAIRKLARPTASAWLVNQLARQAGSPMATLATVGEELAEAQRNLDGDRLRELSGDRRQVINELMPAAEAIARAAGQVASANVLAEVRATLEAAMADSGARAAVQSGRLAKALNYAGLGEVDVTAAFALPGAAPAPAAAPSPRAARSPRTAPSRRESETEAGAGRVRAAGRTSGRDGTAAGSASGEKPAGRSAERARRDAALREAEGAATAADVALTDAEQHLAAVQERSQFLRRRVEHLERELKDARTEEGQLVRDAQKAKRARDAAARRAETAGRELTKARRQAARG